jgi:hypothetical protein
MRSVYGPKWFLNLHKLFLSIFDSTFYVKIRLFSNDFWKIVIKMKWITKYKQIKSISIIASFHIKKQHLDFVFLFSRSTYCTTIFLFSFFFCCFQFFLYLFLNLAESQLYLVAFFFIIFIVSLAYRWSTLLNRSCFFLISSTGFSNRSITSFCESRLL